MREPVRFDAALADVLRRLGMAPVEVLVDLEEHWDEIAGDAMGRCLPPSGAARRGTGSRSDVPAQLPGCCATPSATFTDVSIRGSVPESWTE